VTDMTADIRSALVQGSVWWFCGSRGRLSVVRRTRALGNWKTSRLRSGESAVAERVTCVYRKPKPGHCPIRPYRATDWLHPRPHSTAGRQRSIRFAIRR
jgi:hypothetical protein